MGFLLTAALALQTLLGNAAGEGRELYDNFFYGNYTFYFFTDNYTFDYPTESYTDGYEYGTQFGNDFPESGGSSVQGHLPFFFVLLHLLCFLLQKFTLLL